MHLLLKPHVPNGPQVGEQVGGAAVVVVVATAIATAVVGGVTVPGLALHAHSLFPSSCVFFTLAQSICVARCAGDVGGKVGTVSGKGRGAAVQRATCSHGPVVVVEGLLFVFV